jgi:uncharacterized protein DUF2784
VLQILDFLLSIVHLVLIGFNLLGWIWPQTRKAHLITIVATAASWFILGIWYGMGYCPVTDWQWDVKEKLGETNLPNSFIKYFADKVTGNDLSPSLIDTITVIFFVIAALLSVYVNFFKKKTKSNRQ